MLLEYKAQSFLEELADQILIEQAAAKAGVNVPKEEVEKRAIDTMMSELAECGNDIGEFKKMLRLYGCTLDDRRKTLVREMRWRVLAEELVKKERASAKNLKSLFEKRYPSTAGRLAKVYHILVSADEMRKHLSVRRDHLERRLQVASGIREKAIASELADTKKKLKTWEKRNSKDAAAEAVKKLRSGEDFATIAGEYGAGYTAESYDMGWVTRQWVFKLLAPVIFDQLKKGELAEPVQSRYGFHIVKLVDTRDVSELKYEEVQPYLLDELSSAVVEKSEIAGLILKLRKKAEIERPLFQPAGRDGSGK
jgi:hypothetical protein